MTRLACGSYMLRPPVVMDMPPTVHAISTSIHALCVHATTPSSCKYPAIFSSGETGYKWKFLYKWLQIPEIYKIDFHHEKLEVWQESQKRVSV